MKKLSFWASAFVIFILPFSSHAAPHPSSDLLTISGTVDNEQGSVLKDARLRFFIDGHEVFPTEAVETSTAGRYDAQIRLPGGTLPAADVTVAAEKSSFATSGPVPLEHILFEKTDASGNAWYLAHQNLTLSRSITPAFWIATAVLLLVYGMIALEYLHRTLAALLGAALLLLTSYTLGTTDAGFRILSFEDAMRAIDMNVILLLLSMMIIVGILKKTGVFQWTAYKAFQLSRGNVYALAGIFMVVTAVTSAFLDNVTTMLLIIPVTVQIASTLEIEPIAFLLPEVFASNVGGTATLIGDPPNIMIGSYASLSFIDFVANLAPVCILCLAVCAAYFVVFYRKGYMKARMTDVPEMIRSLREEYRITDKTLLVQGGVILGMVIFLFIIHGMLDMEPSIAAMIGAAILLLVSRVDIVEMLEHEIEWPTLVFFIMLFIVVAGAQEAGLIQMIADWVKNIVGGSLVSAVLIILWVSAVASAIIDNIPFTATMLPIVAYLTSVIPGAEGGILWWALALGACLGGNGTMIGASANVVTVGVADRMGHPISFMQYLRAAALPTLITIVLCSIWLLVMAMP